MTNGMEFFPCSPAREQSVAVTGVCEVRARGGVTPLILCALLVISIIAFVACFPAPPVKLTFVNQSDSLLCFDLSSAGAARDDICDKVKPHARTVWRPECGQAGKQPLTVVLTLGQGGTEVYNRTATCDEWKDSGGKFMIEQRGDGVIVTDSLPNASPGT